MEHLYPERLGALRAEMKAAGIDAVVIPQADPHLSEYLAPHWQVRRWLSGFTGSAGDLVVTASEARLWTDSRYFLQAADQLRGSGIELMKDGLATTPSITDFLCTLPAGATVGVDGMLFPAGNLARMDAALAAKGIRLISDFDVIDTIWKDRPALPDGKIFIHDAKYAGQAAAAKIEEILAGARNAGAEAVLISALDDIAWTLNIRSNDVKHTPVATSYLYLSADRKVLFISPAKLSPETVSYLAEQGVSTADYTDVKAFIAELPAELRIMVETARTAGGVLALLGKRAVVADYSVASRLKAVKNDTQIAGIRAAMVRDGAALVRSFMEIEERLAEGIATTEVDIAEILRRHRSASPLFFDESFGTIAGYGPHGAIVHYEATAATSSTLRPEGLLLIDSGAQYLDGTTDITRTICLGTPTDMERRDFTLVMKGHIALGTMIFPDDTCGAQLDAIARQFLWKNGLSYLHGTGHGVGHFLGVHEGPQSIRLNYVPTVLVPGMVTSNEPGVYREGIHGIRCENLVLTRKEMTTDFGTFLSFETLTLCPFDRALFDLSIMTPDEIKWVNDYHATVRERLMPALATDAERAWLIAHTEPLA
ncbi:MAG: aminopeptidase P family protein [Muribaculaceae bacterium]|nr:aminopeptidase P family protein [Muribaculaceae bacterium]